MASHGCVGQSGSSRRGRTRAKSHAFNRNITVFSPERRVFQVDYARNSVNLKGINFVPVPGGDSVCVLTQRRKTPADTLLDTTMDPVFFHLLQITERLGMLTMGMPADGRALAHLAKNQAAEFRCKWGYEMPPRMLAQWIGDPAQARTQHGVMGPCRVVDMAMGIDEEKGTPKLFTCDPAGLVLGHRYSLTDTTDPFFFHLFQITKWLGMLATGMPADGRALAHYTTKQAAKFCYKWGYEMPPRMSQCIGDTAQVRTQHAGMRHYRVAMAVRIDEEKGTPKLFTCDPTGLVLGHRETRRYLKDWEDVKFLKEEMAFSSSLPCKEIMKTSAPDICSKTPEEGMHSSIYMLSAQKEKDTLSKKTAWKMDSGSSLHATGTLSLLHSIRDMPKQWRNSNNATGAQINFTRIGNVSQPRFRLRDVAYSGNFDETDNIISIPKLTNDGYAIQMGNSSFTIHNASNMNHIVGNGVLDKKLMTYFVRFFNGTVVQPKQKPKEAPQGGKLKTGKDCFVLDSGCPHHLTNANSAFKMKRNVAKGMEMPAVGGGNIKIISEGDVALPHIKLKNVYYSTTTQKLCSVPQLDLSGYHFLFI